jgi:hypothetical protein
MDADVPQWLVQWIYDITAYYRAIMIYYYIIINKNENLILRGPTTSPHQGSWTPIRIKRLSNFALIQLLQTCSSVLPLIAPVKQSILVQVPLRPFNHNNNNETSSSDAEPLDRLSQLWH